MSTTYDDATNILSFEGLIAGKYYTIVPNPPVNNGVDLSAPVSTNTLRRVTSQGLPVICLHLGLIISIILPPLVNLVHVLAILFLEVQLQLEIILQLHLYQVI